MTGIPLLTTLPQRSASKRAAVRTTAPSATSSVTSQQPVGILSRWARHNVRLHRSARKTLRNPLVGEIELTGDALDLPGEDLTLIAYTAEPGSHAQEQLDFLARRSLTQRPSEGCLWNRSHSFRHNDPQRDVDQLTHAEQAEQHKANWTRAFEIPNLAARQAQTPAIILPFLGRTKAAVMRPQYQPWRGTGPDPPVPLVLPSVLVQLDEVPAAVIEHP